ncbi:DUF3592 domain-containing protein [bacterium]|nr:DUF3592 domain-containing protein [bacterium]
MSKDVQGKRSVPNSGVPACLALFGLPFLIIGVGFLYQSLTLFWMYFQSDSWVKTPAIIINAELKDHYGDEGEKTYSIDAKYEYDWKGKKMKGNRVLIESGSSSGFQEKNEMYKLLIEHRNSGEPFLALVNPKKPEQSLLFRRITTGMLIMPLGGGVFAIVGGFLVIGTLWSKWSTSRRQKRFSIDSERPWRAEGLWNDFTAHGKTSGNLVILWLVSLFVASFVGAFVVGLRSDPNAPLWAIILIGSFSLFPIFLMAYSSYLSLRLFKYGAPSLQLSQVPIVVGQKFSGVMTVKKRIFPEKGVKVTLLCTRTQTTGSGEDSVTTTDEVCKKTETVYADLVKGGSDRSAIPFSFIIPPDLPERNIDTNPKYEWKILAEAATPGIDFFAEFEIPVYIVTDPTMVETRV